MLEGKELSAGGLALPLSIWETSDTFLISFYKLFLRTYCVSGPVLGTFIYTILLNHLLLLSFSFSPPFEL